MSSISILMCQLAVTQKKDHLYEWVEYDEVRAQFDSIWSIMDEASFDLVALPETCYFPELHDVYRERSASRIIIAGSAYNSKGINETHIYQDGRHSSIRKIFSSPMEIMELNYPNDRKPDLVIREWEQAIEKGVWPEYFIELPSGGKVAVLTCMDYYRLGYYIANSSVISPHLWGMVAPSSNGQQDIFLRLTRAIHDLNEKCYSVIVNSHDDSRPPDRDRGGSYVYGPITANVKRAMSAAGQTDSHMSAIYQTGEGARALSMSLLPGSEVTFFARSKDFVSNPTNIKEYEI